MRYALPLIPDVAPLRFVGPIRGSRTSSLFPMDELAWSIGKTVDCTAREFADLLVQRVGSPF